MIANKFMIWDQTFPSLCLSGQGIFEFLHGQTTSDVFAHKNKGGIFPSCWLSTKGNLKAVLEIRLSSNMAEIIIICGEINSIRKGFESVIFPADKVDLEVLKPIRRIQQINNYDSWKVSPVSWLGDNSFLSNEGNKYEKVNKKDLELWRIKQGIPFQDSEINGETNPFELGLGDMLESDKGCYLGQEAIARFMRTKSFRYQLRYWEAYGESNNFEVGQKFLNVNQEKESKRHVGFITSSIRIEGNYYAGLALIKTSFLDEECLFSVTGESVAIKKPIAFSDP